MRPGSHSPPTTHDDGQSRNGGCSELAAEQVPDGIEVAIHGRGPLPDAVLDLLAEALIQGYFERSAGQEENAT